MWRCSAPLSDNLTSMLRHQKPWCCKASNAEGLPKSRASMVSFYRDPHECCRDEMGKLSDFVKLYCIFTDASCSSYGQRHKAACELDEVLGPEFWLSTRASSARMVFTCPLLLLNLVPVYRGGLGLVRRERRLGVDLYRSLLVHIFH